MVSVISCWEIRKYFGGVGYQIGVGEDSLLGEYLRQYKLKMMVLSSSGFQLFMDRANRGTDMLFGMNWLDRVICGDHWCIWGISTWSDLLVRN